MNPSDLFHRAAAGLLATLLAVTLACSSTEILGPPDAAACTVGTLRPKAGIPDTVSSRIDADDCRRYSSITLEDAFAESWTLTLEPMTAYVVRLLPSETTPGVVPLSGVLTAIARNAQGDAGIVTIGRVDKDNDRGDTELVIGSADSRTVSLRVEGRTPDAQGPYRMIVEQCPVRELPLDSTVSGVGTTNSCLVRNWSSSPRRLTFASVAVERQGEHLFTFQRTAGTATIRSVVAGPDLDLLGAREGSLRLRTSSASTADSLAPMITVPGRYTFVFETHPDSGATLQLRARPRPLTESSRLP